MPASPSGASAMEPSPSQDGQPVPDATTPPTKEKMKLPDDDFDWGFGSDDDDEGKSLTVQNIIHDVRSAFLIHLLDSGFPAKEKGLLYFILIQLHEHLYSPLYVYSAVPSILMWYYPQIRPRHVHPVIKAIDQWKRGGGSTSKDFALQIIPHCLSSILFKFMIDFQGTAEFIEPVFGPVERWPATLLPVIPGIFFRSTQERPNSINGFVPENKQGVTMAIFISACTAVLPRIWQWWIWAAYAAPSIEYPTMVIDFFVCTFSWLYMDVTPLAGYAMWLLVNQYRHPKTWFRLSGGGPSVVLRRERRGTLYYIVTLILIRLFTLTPWAEDFMNSEQLVLHPRAWIPLAIVVIMVLYLLKYGVMLRLHRYKHKPLRSAKSFRLLRLRAQPCLPNTPVHCDIFHTSLHNPPQYDAISHRWEPMDSTQEYILIEGGLFPVSRSIHTLLMAKRSNLHHCYLFIDSCCIDQNNAEEKSQQVGLMRNIYEEADKMFGWLGNDPDSGKAFALVRKINEASTVAAYASLRSEPEAGWRELETFMSHEWFERAWIIQELAVAKMSILRYGDKSLAWLELSDALARISLFETRLEGALEPFKNSRKLLNALIMEEARAHIEDLDLIKSKDMLKLTLGFKATLPIDKVYAILGLIDERHTPLFHPRFGASDLSGTNRAIDPRNGFRDVANSMRLVADILGAIKGRSNNRRAKAIVASGTRAAVRYIELLNRDMGTAMKKLGNISDSFAELEEERMQPDYTTKTSAHLVYTHVARDLVKQGDAISFICYAGTAIEPHQELTSLPSWVPDWSRDVSVYEFLWCKYDEPVSPSKDPTSEDIQDTTFKDAGSQFLDLRCSVIGTVTHSITLTRDCDATALETLEEVEADFKPLASRVNTALELAKEKLKAYYPSTEDLQQAFYYTLVAHSGTNSRSATSKMRDCTRGLSHNGPIAAALLFERCKGRRDTAADDTGAKESESDQSKAISRYSLMRRKASSVESKLAHLARADVIPSFAQYRSHKTAQSTKQGISILGEEANPLSAYTQYVDYTIGRSFIITDSGRMGLSPAATEEGDIVVEVRSRGRIVWLTLRKDLGHEGLGNEGSNASKASQEADDQPPIPKTYRLVGEAFVHGQATREAPPIEDLQWIKLS